LYLGWWRDIDTHTLKSQIKKKTFEKKRQC
jgi:hypothetical protein